jgi:hypothetical protein
MKLTFTWHPLLGAISLLFIYSCFEPLDFEAIQPVCDAPSFDVTSRDQFCGGTFASNTSYAIPGSVFDLDALGDKVLVASGSTLNVEGLSLLRQVSVQISPRTALFEGEDDLLSAPVLVADERSLPDFASTPRFAKLVYEEPPVAALAVSDRLALVEVKPGANPLPFALPERTLFSAPFAFDLSLYAPQRDRVDALVALGPAGVKPVAFERQGGEWKEKLPDFSAEVAQTVVGSFCAQISEDQPENEERCLNLCVDCKGRTQLQQRACSKCVLDRGAFFLLGELRHAYSLDIASSSDNGRQALFVGGFGEVLRYGSAESFLVSELQEEIMSRADLLKGYEPDEAIPLPRPRGAPAGQIVTTTRVEDEAAYFVAQDSMLWGLASDGTYMNIESFPKELGAAYLYVAPRAANGSLGELRAVELPEGLRSSERVVVAPIPGGLVAVRGLRSQYVNIEGNVVRQGYDPVLVLVDVLDPAQPAVVWSEEGEGVVGEVPQGLVSSPTLKRLLLPGVEQISIYDASLGR